MCIYTHAVRAGCASIHMLGGQGVYLHTYCKSDGRVCIYTHTESLMAGCASTHIL